MQPGQTITPGSSNEQSSQDLPQAPATNQEQQATVSQLPVQGQTIAQPASVAPTAAPEQPVAVYQEQSETPVEQLSDDAATASWSASEYIDHAKGPVWFAGLGIVLFALVALVYVVLKDVLAAVLLALAGISFGVFAGRRPQVLVYTVSPSGITVGQRNHDFSEFKSFSMTHSGNMPVILLMPLKRFLPPLTIFYDPNDEESIVNALANYLPYEEREPDMVDRLMSRIKF